MTQVLTFPHSPFELHSDYAPAGDQPSAIASLVDGLESGFSAQTLLGVTGSGKTYTMANVIARIGTPALVMAPNKTLAAQLYSEMRDFFPNNAVEYFVSYYDYYQPEAYVPARDLFIEKDSAINEHIEQMRLAATKSILERRDTIIVATVSAIYGIGKPESYTQMRLILRQGDTKSRDDLIRQLVKMQYRRNDADFMRGTFRVRGDTIDVFPAEHAEVAVRIELFDDELEAIVLFDPLTGRTQQRVPRFVVYPASHYVTPRAEIVRAMDSIRAELKDRLKFFNDAGKIVEAQRLQQRTLFDLEMLDQVGFCKGIENYSRHLTGLAPGEAPPCLIDYLPADSIITILGNLIENAFDALADAPADILHEVTVSLCESDHGLILSVDDNGPGMEEAMRARLFHRGATTKGTGHGTGLFLVKRAVDTYGGEIRVESTKGVGSSFIVTFRPAQDGPAGG